MRKLFIISILFLLLGSFVFAQEETITKDILPFLPVTPRVMAQGGAFVAVAEGYESLYYNPAGFARTSFDLTISSLTAWIYMNPGIISNFIDTMNAGAETMTEEEKGLAMIKLVDDQVANGGIGVGASAGAGVMLGGIGAGVALTVDGYLEGDGGTIDASGDLVATLGAVLGYAHTFNLLGMKLNVGGDLRPMYRIHSVITNREALQLVTQMLSPESGGDIMGIIAQTNALTGFGCGIDIGGILEMGPFLFGLSIRDLFGTPFKYYKNPMQDVVEALPKIKDIPATEENLETVVKYVIPMNVSAGAAINLNLLRILELTVHGDLQDVIGVIKYGRSIWTLLHIGAEAKLLGMLKARAGFNQGYITMGVGAHLLFLDVNVAFFTRELGKFIKD